MTSVDTNSGQNSSPMTAASGEVKHPLLLDLATAFEITSLGVVSPSFRRRKHRTTMAKTRKPRIYLLSRNTCITAPH